MDLKERFEKIGISCTLFKNHAGPESPYWKSVKLTKNQLALNNLKLSREVDRSLQAIEFLTYCRSILPLLINQYDIVFSDRYSLSKLVYGRVELDEPTQAESMIMLADDIPVPDLTIYLSVTVLTALNRINSRNIEKDWKEEPENLEKALSIYDRFVQNNPNIIVIDGEKSKSELADKMFDTIYNALNLSQ